MNSTYHPVVNSHMIAVGPFDLNNTQHGDKKQFQSGYQKDDQSSASDFNTDIMQLINNIKFTRTGASEAPKPKVEKPKIKSEAAPPQLKSGQIRNQDDGGLFVGEGDSRINLDNLNYMRELNGTQKNLIQIHNMVADDGSSNPKKRVMSGLPLIDEVGNHDLECASSSYQRNRTPDAVNYYEILQNTQHKKLSVFQSDAPGAGYAGTVNTSNVKILKNGNEQNNKTHLMTQLLTLSQAFNNGNNGTSLNRKSQAQANQAGPVSNESSFKKEGNFQSNFLDKNSNGSIAKIDRQNVKNMEANRDLLNIKFDQTLKDDKSPKAAKKRRKSSFMVGAAAQNKDNPAGPSPIFTAAKKQGGSPKALAIKKNRRMSEAPANIMRFNLKLIK